MGGFRRFNRWYLRKHFHAVAVDRSDLIPAGLNPDDSLVVYANHASWWDPLIAMYLCEQVFPGFRMYAPIDAEAFKQYRIFGQMGFFPVEQDSLVGAAGFLKKARRILEQPSASVWITPEGRFVDVRDTSATFMPGLAHLATSHQMRSKRPAGRVWFVSAAVEYTFWEERLPELLVRLGKPLLAEGAKSKEQWQSDLTDSLRQAQQKLATAAITRDTSGFEVMLRNRSGTFFLYDWWRSLTTKRQSASQGMNHSDKFA